MNSVLVVDDSSLDRRLASALLVEVGFDVQFAEDGRDALQKIESRRPDVVVTDLQMPVMDGLELVGRLQRSDPTLPVILMTAYGSEEIAVKACNKGASSYVPKSKLGSDLGDTVRNVLIIAQKEARTQLPAEAMTYFESHFELDPTLSKLDGLIAYVQRCLEQLKLCDPANLIRVGTALHEAIVNASEHGNLELSSELRENESGLYHDLVRKRSKEPPYSERHVYIKAVLSQDQAKFEIRDEGPGFDTTNLPDPTNPENLAKVSGRGLFLIRTFMDDVCFNEAGNQITMVKFRETNDVALSP